MKIIIALSFIIQCMPAVSVSQITKADTFIVTKGIQNIKPGSKKYIQYTEYPNGLIRFQSILTRKVEKTNYKGKEQFLITQTYQTGNSIDRDSSYCDSKTLMPLGYFTDIPSEGHKEKVIFSEHEIDNTVIYKDSINRSNKINPHFYNGVVADEIITAMPLKEAAKFVIKMVMPGERYDEYIMEVEVLGKEELDIPVAGKVQCWKLRTSARAGSSSLEWYSVKGQVQLKKRFEFNGGYVFCRVMIAGI
ncbi:MAG: hypothetical protein QM737_02370 [Ferruginibacter sp.]